jgi:hypothetical protein
MEKAINTISPPPLQGQALDTVLQSQLDVYHLLKLRKHAPSTSTTGDTLKALPRRLSRFQREKSRQLVTSPEHLTILSAETEWRPGLMGWSANTSSSTEVIPA